MKDLDLKNFTGRLRRAEAFIRAKFGLIRTRGLSIRIKYTRAYDAEISGYYRWDDRRMVVAVQPGLRYPFKAAYSVASKGRGRHARLSTQQIWYEELFDSADDLLVFVAGHEMWHYLCHTRQRRGDQETKANCHGFMWLREFKRWRGSESRVARIPESPPRPDKRRASAQRRTRRRKVYASPRRRNGPNPPPRRRRAAR